MTRLGLVLMAGGFLVAAQPVSAQGPATVDGSTPDQVEAAEQDRPPVEETELVFEREVFSYPSFSRRNPFKVLVASQAGPRFEQIRLGGLIHADNPRESVALLSIRTEQLEQSTADDPDASPGVLTEHVRVGESWGNVRVLEIRRTEILVEVEEFGLTEQRIMRLPTRSNRARGGS